MTILVGTNRSHIPLNKYKVNIRAITDYVGGIRLLAPSKRKNSAFSCQCLISLLYLHQRGPWLGSATIHLYRNTYWVSAK